MTSPLTPTRGYVWTLTQLEGGRPVARIACTSCDWEEGVPVTVADSPADLGVKVGRAVVMWADHPHKGYVGTDIKPQDFPAVPYDPPTIERQA